MNSRILLIEDEPGLVLTLSDLLAAEGYTVESATDGLSGLAKATRESFDGIILDVILMLTAKTQIIDRVVGLKLGADDYLTKPFDPSELLARVEALLRRVNKDNLTPALRFQFGAVEVDFEKAEVLKNGVAVNLAGKELHLLRYLIDHRGKVLSRDELLREVWEYQPDVSTRTVDVHVAWLRQKLESNPQFPKHILTVRGSGYRFSP